MDKLKLGKYKQKALGFLEKIQKIWQMHVKLCKLQIALKRFAQSHSKIPKGVR